MPDDDEYDPTEQEWLDDPALFMMSPIEDDIELVPVQLTWLLKYEPKYRVIELKPPSGERRDDIANIKAFFWGYEATGNQKNPIPRHNFKMAANLIAHLNAETERHPRLTYILQQGRNPPENIVYDHNKKKLNRFYLLCMILYQCTGRCHIRGRKPVVPKYVYLDRTNCYIIQSLLEALRNVMPITEYIDLEETSREFVESNTFWHYYESFRPLLTANKNFWRPNAVYAVRQKGPSTNYHHFFRLINFNFQPVSK